MQAGEFQLQRQSLGLASGHIDDYKVLSVGGAQLACAIAVGEISSNSHLLRVKSSSQHGSSHIKESGLQLSMDASVVAEYICGHLFGFCRIQRIAQPFLHLG